MISNMLNSKLHVVLTLSLLVNAGVGKIQTHSRVKRMLFIMAKHIMRIMGVSLFFKVQNNT